VRVNQTIKILYKKYHKYELGDSLHLLLKTIIMSKQLPEKFIEKYSTLSSEELLEKLYDAEQASVEYKKENKKNTDEFSEREKDYLKRLEKLESETSERAKADFLRDKSLTDDEKKVFEEKLGKGYDLQDAYNVATLESQKAQNNADKVNN
jgi:hypothetical protein